MSLLRFIKDQDYDTEMIFVMLEGRSEQALLESAKTMEITFNDAKKIAGGDEILAKTIANKKYAKVGDILNGVIKAYQRSWDDIDQKFFDRLIELTRFPLAHNNYECVVSLFHPGLSNWGGNKIVRIWDKDAKEQRRITAHELIIAHFFSLMHKKYPEIDDQKIWSLAEVYAFAVTGLDPVVKDFWPWDKTGAYTDHNYPELVRLQDHLTPHFANIDVFIEKGLAFYRNEK